MSKSFYEIFIGFCRHTTFVAVPNIFLSSRIAFRLIYLVVFVGSTGVCISFIYSSFITYFSYEISTLVTLKPSDKGSFIYQIQIKISLIKTKMFNKETSFPSVTICNLQICGFKDYRYSTSMDE